MSEFKNKRKTNFTTVGNAALLNLSLSLKAKGLLSIMLSRPDGWVYRMDWIAKQSRDGRESTQAAMKELIEHGYVVRSAKRSEVGGKFDGWAYEVSDDPADLLNNPSDGLTEGRESRQAVPQSLSSNKELINTDFNNTDLIIITPSLSASLQDADAAHEISKNFLKEEVEEVIAEEKQELQETQGGEKGRKVWSSKVAGIVKSKQHAKFSTELTKLLKPDGAVNVLTLVSVLAGNEEKILAGMKRKPAIVHSLNVLTADQLGRVIKEAKERAASYPDGWQSVSWVQALDILASLRVSNGAAEWPSRKTSTLASASEKLGPNSTPDPRFFYSNGVEWRRYSPVILAQRLMERAALDGVTPYSVALEYLEAQAVNQEFVDDFRPREEER